MEKSCFDEKVTITCNKMEMSMLGIFIHHDFEHIMGRIQKKWGLTPMVIKDFGAIVDQMANAIREDIYNQLNEIEKEKNDWLSQ
jgi:hypothetical protein